MIGEHWHLIDKYVELRVSRIMRDAENSTSYREEIETLVRRADDVERLTVAELREMIANMTKD